ncbi:hypothetical protein [Oceanobacillus damuensis]|uniref:hypothetical protein n=1 Tax=Oceanobacillus damuensis TaxID=937928 RepID=UPI00082E85FE|nr:hypothetical protein [Oceanobacillus damuensis]
MECKGPRHASDAERFIDGLIEKYKLNGKASIVNNCFDEGGKLEMTLTETVEGYLKLGNKL